MPQIQISYFSRHFKHAMRLSNRPKKFIKRDFNLDFPSLHILCFPDFGVMSEASEVVGKSNLGWSDETS